MPRFSQGRNACAPAYSSAPVCSYPVVSLPAAPAPAIEGTGSLASTQAQSHATQYRSPNKGFEVQLDVLNERIGQTEKKWFRMSYTEGPNGTQIPKLEEWDASKKQYVSSNFKIKFYADGALYSERGEHLGAFGINQNVREQLKDSPVIDTYGTLETRNSQGIHLETYGNFTKTFAGEKTLIINAPPPNTQRVFLDFSKQVLEDRSDGGGLYMRSEKAKGYTMRWVSKAEAEQYAPKYSVEELASMVATGDAKKLGESRWQTKDGLIFGSDTDGYFIERQTYLATNLYDANGLSYGSGRIERQRDLKVLPPKVPVPNGGPNPGANPNTGPMVTPPAPSTPVSPPQVAPKTASQAPTVPQLPKTTVPPFVPQITDTIVPKAPIAPQLPALNPNPQPTQPQGSSAPEVAPAPKAKEVPVLPPTVLPPAPTAPSNNPPEQVPTIPKVVNEPKAKDSTSGGQNTTPKETPQMPPPPKLQEPIQPPPLAPQPEMPVTIPDAFKIKEFIDLLEARAVTKALNREFRGDPELTQNERDLIAGLDTFNPLNLATQIDRRIEDTLRTTAIVGKRYKIEASPLFDDAKKALMEERLEMSKQQMPKTPLAATTAMTNRLQGSVSNFELQFGNILPTSGTLTTQQWNVLQRTTGLGNRFQKKEDFEKYYKFLLDQNKDCLQARPPVQAPKVIPKGNAL